MINKKGPSGVAAPSRPKEHFQDNYNTKLEIKQVSLASKEDVVDLLRVLDRNIDAIVEGRTIDAVQSLTELKDSIENHLGGMK